MTDDGNGLRLVRLHKLNLRYVHIWKKWIVWEEEKWKIDVDDGVMRLAKATIEDIFREAQEIRDEEKRKSWRSHAAKSQNIARLNAMISLAESELPVILPLSRIDADPWMLPGVPNGVINLEAGEFRAARREDYIVKRAAIGYDPKATCPQWRKFLARILPEDMVPYVQRVVGYTLTGFTGEEILFVLWGDGANGKSTFRDTIFTMLGDYAMASDADLLVMPKRGEGARATPEVARLNGKRLVTVNEIRDGDVLNESRVKFITGQDVINARSLFQEPFDFWPTHKGFITTQHKPIIKGVDEGIWRRIHLWPFEYMFPEKERDPHFRQDVLTPELPGES